MSKQRRRSLPRTAIVTATVLGGAVAVAVGVELAAPFAVAAVLAIGVFMIRDRRGNAAEPAPDLPGAEPAVNETPIDLDGLHRRRALKLLGLGALGAVPVAAAPGLVERIVRGGVGGNEPGSGLAAAADSPATASDGRIRQWTMIIDLLHCDGCQSQGTPPQCTLACIEGHFAPEPMEWIEVYEDEHEGGGTEFVPTPCQQCQNPPCVNVCPVGATFSTPEGIVLIDQDRCIGCRICMAACPYDRRFFNWGTPPVPPEALLVDYSPDHQAPSQRGTVMKCDFCPDMARAGTLPFCIQACPNNAIYYGDLEEDIATNGHSIVRVSKFLSEHHAHRLKENLGTEPRVYYIPGHGELVGRDPRDTGRMPTEWPWVERAKGSESWSR